MEQQQTLGDVVHIYVQRGRGGDLVVPTLEKALAGRSYRLWRCDDQLRADDEGAPDVAIVVSTTEPGSPQLLKRLVAPLCERVHAFVYVVLLLATTTTGDDSVYKRLHPKLVVRCARHDELDKMAGGVAELFDLPPLVSLVDDRDLVTYVLYS
jgi:hypothetical protein